MKKKKTIGPPRKKPRARIFVLVIFLILLVVGGAVGGILLTSRPKDDKPASATPNEEAQETKPLQKRETGLIASLNETVEYCDENGAPLGTLPRGSQVEYNDENGRIKIFADDVCGFLQEGASIVTDPSAVIPPHTAYVKTAVNLRDADGKLLDVFAHKGGALEVLGCDFVDANGKAHMLRIQNGGAECYVMPHYLAQTEEEATANYDNGSYGTHAGRTDRYGGGDAASLDYFPREKGAIEGNPMPAEVRALYITAWRVKELDSYLAAAAGSGINAFVVDIADSGAIGYASTVMQTHCPSAASAAHNTAEEYKDAIQKLKNAGYYVIGRITTFNDTYFVKDHPEYAIADANGSPLKLSGEYWPTAYSRTVWQYKVDLAVEAVKEMGFHEIQFDYVRFPDRTGKYEKAGTINFRNSYGETKAQAIQRFLMYATDILHENGAYVSADVFGESAYTYVTAYGQYWPAISGVVDVISGMPYPDHFAASGDWRPWEHPYETLNKWGKNVMTRQQETENPAIVRTWIQAYNAIREPYNTYGPDEVLAQIRGLRDAGCTGGYITWNAGSSLDKYKRLMPAFAS